MKKDTLDKLLKEVKQNRSEEYRSAYVDGVLDAFNEDNKLEVAETK